MKIRILKVSLVALIMLLSKAAYSSIDGSLTALYRNDPKAGGLNTNLGWNQLLWGAEGSKPLYGFIRPNISYFTAGTFNANTLEIEVNPISFISYEYGIENFHNNGIYADYDCEVYQCQSKFKNTYYKINLLLGYGPVFFKATIKNEELEAKKVSKDFIYPNIGSALDKNGDTIETREITGGMNFGQYQLIYQDKKSEIEVRKNTHRTRAFILGVKSEPLKYLFSVGKFSSHEVPDSTYGAVILQMHFGTTLKLD